IRVACVEVARNRARRAIRGLLVVRRAPIPAFGRTVAFFLHSFAVFRLCGWSRFTSLKLKGAGQWHRAAVAEGSRRWIPRNNERLPAKADVPHMNAAPHMNSTARKRPRRVDAAARP